MSNTSMIGIPPRRLDQLKAIGAALNLSVADSIGHMIRREIAAGTIPDAIPGIVIKKVKDGVQITIDDGATKTLTRDGARSLVSDIRDVLAGQAAAYNLDYAFSVSRRGTGIKIAVPFPGVEHSFSPDLARDFARLVEDEAG
mgnify:CR=1 FL=1